MIRVRLERRLQPLTPVTCPDCPPAREARALVVADGAWLNAVYALLPFAVVLLAVLWFTRRLDGGRS